MSNQLYKISQVWKLLLASIKDTRDFVASNPRQKNPSCWWIKRVGYMRREGFIKWMRLEYCSKPDCCVFPILQEHYQDSTGCLPSRRVRSNDLTWIEMRVKNNVNIAQLVCFIQLPKRIEKGNKKRCFETSETFAAGVSQGYSSIKFKILI